MDCWASLKDMTGGELTADQKQFVTPEGTDFGYVWQIYCYHMYADFMTF